MTKPATHSRAAAVSSDPQNSSQHPQASSEAAAGGGEGPIRVLHVLDHSLPLHSGYTFRTRAIMRAQQASGMEVRGITGLRHFAEGPAKECCDDLIFYRSSGTASGPAGMREWLEIARFASGVEQAMEDWQPDILHAHSPALCGHAALRAARRRGIPVVYEIRAFWEDAAVGNGTGREGSIKYRMTRALENRAVSAADAVFTICHGLRDDLIQRGFPGGKIGISPNGVDLNLFGAPVQPDPKLAKELGLTGGPVLGFVGSFYDYEGLDDLIAAMPMIRRNLPDAQLLLVGGGPMNEALRAQAAASDAAEAIHFTGRVPHDTVERYYALTDILVYPRKASRLTELVTPLKPLEAMAQRRLVAASTVGGHRELISDGQTGTLFAPDDPEALAEAIISLNRRRDTWDTIRDRAQAHIAEAHDWANNIDRYQVVYQTLLGHSNAKLRSQAA